MKKHFLSFIVCIVLFASCDTNEPTNKKNIGIGKFSVSESKQVTFSPGNLQYTQSTNTWSFAENQWDYIGTNNVIGGSASSDVSDLYEGGAALADKVDLFGWSTSANNFGVSTSTDYNDYSGSFVDWGTNKIGNDAPNTWRTLTADEWRHLRDGRPNASSLIGVARVNGVNGLILLPDDWPYPVDIIFKSGFQEHYNADNDYAVYQTFNAAQWSKLEAAGAVFLPAAGIREKGTNLFRVQDGGYYWSSTEYDSDEARGFCFESDGRYMDYSERFYGMSVRLVKDL